MLEGTHENREDLARLLRGEGTAAEAQRVAEHVLGCKECWGRAMGAIADQEAVGEIATPGPLRMLVDLYRMERDRADHWVEAQKAWPEVRSLGLKTRRDKVRLTRALHTVSFLEVLLAEGNGPVPPLESEEIFNLSFIVARQLPEPKFSPAIKNDLAAECCAEIANARRRSAKWMAARDALKKGFEYAEKGSRSPVVEGKILCVEGALEADLANFDLARKHLRRAAGLFESASNALLWSRTLVQLANALVEVQPPESLHAVDEALAVMPPNNPRLTLFAEGVKVECLVALGKPREALSRFEALRDLYEQFLEPYVQLGRRATLARILDGLGDFEGAVSLFNEVITGDIEHGWMKKLFLDLVVLFGVYLRHGQPDGAISVCQRAIRELSLVGDGEEGSDEAAREQMRTVWKRLEEGVRRGTVEAGAVAVMRRYITAHWRTPAPEPPVVARP
jgi:tetratricopeptide (TPR) repeat protein